MHFKIKTQNHLTAKRASRNRNVTVEILAAMDAKKKRIERKEIQ